MTFVACESKDVFRFSDIFEFLLHIRNNIKVSSVVRSLKNKHEEVPTAQIMELGVSCPFLYCFLRIRLIRREGDLGFSYYFLPYRCHSFCADEIYNSYLIFVIATDFILGVISVLI